MFIEPPNLQNGNCIATNNWGCGINAQGCCNPSSVCGSDHMCKLPCGTTYPPSPSPSAIPSVSNASHPYCLKTGGQISRTKASKIKSTVNKIKKSFYGQLPTSPFNLSNIFGQSIRVAFHDAAEIDLTNPADMMGPDGCVSDTIPNFGLTNASSFVNTLLDPIWQKYCDVISRGDFWALIGKLSVEIADPTKSINIPYYYGRVDKSDCFLPNSFFRPPSPLAGFNTIAGGLIQGFVGRMGLTINDIGDQIMSHLL